MFKLTNPPDGEEAEGKGGQERGKGEEEEEEEGGEAGHHGHWRYQNH